MNLLIRSAIIVDPDSTHNGMKKDILIIDGKIIKIDEHILNTDDVTEYTVPNLHVSQGFVDMQANFRDPGYEHKEDLKSGAAASVKGGFTKVCIQSSTNPALDHKSAIESICKQSEKLPIDILPIGTLTNKREGKEMAELFDMHQNGAIAFSDDKRAIENPKLLELILEYCKNFNGLVIHFPDTPSLTKTAIMHEGEVSVNLGLKGFPAIAEELAINRDLYLLEYTQSKMHISLISCANSVKLIREAKSKGLKISSGIAPQYLIFRDKNLSEFDAVHKVKPPYRNDEHIYALIQGLKNETIDVICSDHSPEDVENKRCELEHAAFGIINLETCFPAARTALKDNLSIEELIMKFTTNPRKILELKPATIEEGNIAELTFFDPDMQWTYQSENIHSKSDNTPFIDYQFTGKVLGIFCKKEFHQN